MTGTVLSKSQYIKGKQCSKALWYHHHRQDLLAEAEPLPEIRFEMGRQVGELARTLFPGGHLIDCKPWETEQSLQFTQESIQQGATILYEAAALTPDGVYARADILVKTSAGTWNLIEVKSTTSVKEAHLDDVAIQYYAFAHAGYAIERCMVMYINNEYVKHGEIDVAALFKKTDITEEVLKQQPATPALVTMLKYLVAEPNEPQIGIGPQCSAPYDCNYQSHCWRDVPEYSIFNVLQAKKAFELATTTGSYEVKHIPTASLPKGAKAIDVQSFLQDAVHADKAKLQEFLKPLQFPIYYLDFETIGSAMPLFDGTKPYQNVPFQFSLHIEHAADRLESRGYLHWQQTDPREDFVEKLLQECGDAGPIIVYNQAFEAGCVKALAEVFPQHTDRLMALNERMVDLLVPFRQRWLYSPKQNGSASIKAVLPAFTDKGYDELAIANGASASEQYLAYMMGKLPEQERNKLYSDLVAYCELDTYAMVTLIRAIREISSVPA